MGGSKALARHRFSPKGRLLGILLAVLAAVFASSAGVLVRQVEPSDAWTLLAYRSLGFVVTLLLFIAVCHGKASVARFAAIGREGIVVALSLGAAFIAFLLALVATNVATVVAVLGAAPMVAGLLGWAFIGERPSGAAWLAMLAAILGVSLIAWSGLGSGSALGLGLAVLACLGYAAAIVGLRAGSARDMSPAVCLSGVFAGLVSVTLADGLVAEPGVVLVGLLLGSVQIGAQYILLTIATRFAPASDVALAMVLELVLAPLWVWAFVGEAAPRAVLLGGGIVATAVILNAAASDKAIS